MSQDPKAQSTQSNLSLSFNSIMENSSLILLNIFFLQTSVGSIQELPELCIARLCRSIFKEISDNMYFKAVHIQILLRNS